MRGDGFSRVSIDGRAELLASRTGDAEDGQVIVDDGLGVPLTWSIRNLLATEQGLVIGTASNLFLPYRLGPGRLQRELDSLGLQVFLATDG